MNIGIYIYEQAEVLDFSGPYEVFSTASRLLAGNEALTPFLIAESANLVTARAGYQVMPHYSIYNHPRLDVLIIAGGVHDQEMTKPPVIEWIAKQSEHVSITASVCTGAFLLAQAEVINQHKVTTHWQDIDELQRSFSHLNVVKGKRWVDEGNIVTSGGISAGIDMSLHLVSRLYSLVLAENTAKQMEFSWTQNAQP